MPDRSHLLPAPLWMLVLRGVQLVLGIIILGLAAYGINYFPFGGGFDGINLTMYATIETLITVVYILIATLAFPLIYNYWAILGLDALGVIFWLSSFALLASEVSTYKSDYDNLTSCAYTIDGYCVYKRSIEKRYTTWSDYYHSMAAAAGLGAIEFVLFVATLVFTGLWLFRHRAAGGHSMPGNTGNTTSALERKPAPLNNENGATAVPVADV